MNYSKKIYSAFKKSFRYSLFFLLLFFSIIVSASAQDYYVDINTGDDANDGSAGSPWETIHYAISQMAASQTLNVAAGTYSISNGESDQPIAITVANLTILGDSGGGTQLDLNGASTWLNGFSIGSTSSIRISNIEVANATDSGIKVENSISDIVIEDCRMRDSTNGFLLYNTSGVIIKRCDIFNNIIGVYIKDSDSTTNIIKNKISDNQTGVQIETVTAAGSNEPNIINNLIFDGSNSGLNTGIKIYTPVSTSTAAPVILHNTIDGGSLYGIEINPDAASIAGEIKYNNITNFTYGIYVTMGSPSTYLDYNNVYNNSSGNYFSITAGANSISSDPSYNNSGIHDYHLNAGSGSVDAATTSVITDDLDGTTRPEGSFPDIGCYEHLVNPASFIFNPDTNLETSENGGTATFNVHLSQTPSGDVTITFSSSDTSEGTVSPSSLTFTASDWDTDQTITITGVDDNVNDGDRNYEIITGPASSSDTLYNNLDPQNIGVTNIDNNGSGVKITIPSSGLVTDESGASATFTIALKSQPEADVTIPISSSDTNEGTPSPTSITFTQQNWEIPQSITVTGVDDNVLDGDKEYSIKLETIVSSDSTYNGIDPDDVTFTNEDNDNIEIVISSSDNLFTTEEGGTAVFDISLSSSPSLDVNIPISSTNTDEGIVSTSSVTFTNANWNTPQTITITGMDDAVSDGDIEYFIKIGPSTSTDSTADSLTQQDIKVKNIDDDIPGIIVSPTSGIFTSSNGTTADFQINLKSKPSSDVTISLESSNTNLGTVSPASVTFTDQNWDTLQTITITGASSASSSTADNSYYIITKPAVSSDSEYNGKDPDDVFVDNKIIKTLTIRTSSASGGSVTAEGITCPSDCTGEYHQGSSVTLTASASKGSDFKYFQDQDGNIFYKNPVTIYMDKDKTIDAIFGAEGNSPADKPQIISPKDLSINPDTSIVIQSSAFQDTNNDQHKSTYWKIKRYDDQQYSNPELEGSLSIIKNIESGESLTEYNLTGLESGIKYLCQIGYLDSGSGKYSWSDEISFTIGSVEKQTYQGVSPGTEMKNYKMISFTSFPKTPKSGELFGLVEGFDKSVLRLGSYDPVTSSYIEYPNVNIKPGRAYWILSRNGYNQISFDGVKVTTLRDVEVPLSFNSSTGEGWNMIAPPNDANYIWEEIEIVVYDPDNGKIVAGPISIADLKSRHALISNPFIEVSLWRWESGEYFNDTQIIEAGKGYWIKVKSPGVSLVFPNDARALQKTDKKIKIAEKIIDFISPKSANAEADHPPFPMEALPLAVFEKADSKSGCFISNLK